MLDVSCVLLHVRLSLSSVLGRVRDVGRQQGALRASSAGFHRVQGRCASIPRRLDSESLLLFISVMIHYAVVADDYCTFPGPEAPSARLFFVFVFFFGPRDTRKESLPSPYTIVKLLSYGALPVPRCTPLSPQVPGCLFRSIENIQ